MALLQRLRAQSRVGRSDEREPIFTFPRCIDLMNQGLRLHSIEQGRFTFHVRPQGSWRPDTRPLNNGAADQEPEASIYRSLERIAGDYDLRVATSSEGFSLYWRNHGEKLVEQERANRDPDWTRLDHEYVGPEAVRQEVARVHPARLTFDTASAKLAGLHTSAEKDAFLERLVHAAYK